MRERGGRARRRRTGLNPSTWPLWRELLPHVLTATDTRHTLDPTGDDVSWLLDHAGGYELTRGEPASAGPLLERALRLRRSVLGEDHPDTLKSASDLAINLDMLGHHEQARQLQLETLTRRRRVLGDDHPRTLASADNLRALGRDDEANQLEERVLQGDSRACGGAAPRELCETDMGRALGRRPRRVHGQYPRASQPGSTPSGMGRSPARWCTS